MYKQTAFCVGALSSRQETSSNRSNLTQRCSSREKQLGTKLRIAAFACCTVAEKHNGAAMQPNGVALRRNENNCKVDSCSTGA